MTADDAGQAIGTSGGSIYDIAASIEKKLGGDDKPRDERGRFVSTDDSNPDDNAAEEGSEAEAETAEGETEAEDATDAGEETEEGSEQQPQKFTVKANGEEISVTLDELLKGYSREADYTRSKQALSSEKATWEATREQSLKADRDALAADREQAKQVLAGWQSFIEAQFGNKEYWDNLRRENPGEWAAQQQALAQQLQQVQAQASELRKKDDDKRASDLRTHQAAEFQKLVTAIPEWKDQAKLNDGYQKIADYAVKTRGFKPEDLQAIVNDHRLALVLKDAAAFHALEQKKPEIAPKLKDIKPAKPGVSTQTPSKATKLNKASERFVKNGGKVEDLAAVLAQKYNL